MKTIATAVLVMCLSFTSFAQKTIQASDIISDVKNGKEIKISNATIKGAIDFTFMDDALPNLPKKKRWWKNNSNTIKKQITSKISFTNCVFENDVLAYIHHEKSKYTFVANFEDTVVFNNCTFKQKAMFKYSDFEKNTDFSNSHFKGESTFKYADFDKDITFENTRFIGNSTFKYSEFEHFVSFKNAVFNKSATFKYAEFDKGVSFKNVKFEKDLNIKYTKVSGAFDIDGMNVAAEIDSKYTKINGESFNKALLK